MQDYDNRIKKTKELIAKSDCIIIGAGAGLSTAGGFEYSGDIFKEHFKDFIDKYKFQDMYSAGFYQFETEEEYWAYWSRYVYINRYLHTEPNKIYSALYNLVKNRDYFVITTNVDHQFQIANFDKKRLFYMQGDYGLFQCSIPCHNKTYDNKEIILKMVENQSNMKIPRELIPLCPVCKKPMAMNLRADDRFVQDEGWYEHFKLYQNFIDKSKDKNIVLMEIGVGYNTPSIIKYPFERMTYSEKNTYLIRVNKDYAVCPNEIKNKTVLFDENVGQILRDII